MLHLKDVVAFDKLGQLDEFVLLAPHEVSFKVRRSCLCGAALFALSLN